MYDRVLYPTDGSDGAATATDHALELARRFDAPLHALYVVDTSAIQATDAFATSNYESTYDALESEGRTQLEAVTDRAAAADVDASTEILEGQPASSIVDATTAGDVVVMGTHGRNGLDRYLLGSTTEKVVRTATVPVVVVPLNEDESS